MPSSVWRVCCPLALPPPRRLAELRVTHRVDVEFRHTLDSHLVTKTSMNNCRPGMINGTRAIVIVNVGLLPSCAVFQLDQGTALKTAKRTIDAAHNRIHFKRQ